MYGRREKTLIVIASFCFIFPVVYNKNIFNLKPIEIVLDFWGLYLIGLVCSLLLNLCVIRRINYNEYLAKKNKTKEKTK